MRREFTFIDQTLKYALRQGRIDITEFMRLKRRVPIMDRMVFDLPLDLLQRTVGRVQVELQDVRLGIAPDVGQVRLAASLGCPRIKIKLKRETAPRLMESVLEVARECDLQVSLHGINIGRSTLMEIEFFQKIVSDYAVAHLIIDDSESRLDPFSTQWTLREWRGLFPAELELEYCGRNQLGLAAGNALGAVKSGVRRLVVSCGGVGGFPAWEEVAMGIKHLLQLPLAIPADLAVRCRGLLEAIGVEVAVNKPIIGSGIFAHESGIHVDGIFKRSELYEPYAPEDVGLTRQIVIGKHSGKAALQAKLEELDLVWLAPDLPRILEKVRQLAVAQKAPVIDAQLRQLVKEVTLL
jgi:homocitrate synthase NifV